MGDKKVSELNESMFESYITEKNVVSLVDFWAPWCGPCKAMSPVLEALANEVGPNAKIGKVNIDENQELAVKFSVRSIPTLLIFKNGEIVDKMVGLTNKDVLAEKIKTHCK